MTSEQRELIAELNQFITAMAWEMTATEIAAELVMLAKHGADWQRMSQRQWEHLIDVGVRAGELRINDEGRIGPKQIISAPSQLSLF